MMTVLTVFSAKYVSIDGENKFLGKYLISMSMSSMLDRKIRPTWHIFSIQNNKSVKSVLRTSRSWLFGLDRVSSENYSGHEKYVDIREGAPDFARTYREKVVCIWASRGSDVLSWIIDYANIFSPHVLLRYTAHKTTVEPRGRWSLEATFFSVCRRMLSGIIKECQVALARDYENTQLLNVIGHNHVGCIMQKGSYRWPYENDIKATTGGLWSSSSPSW